MSALVKLTITATLLATAIATPSNAEVPLLWRDGVATPCPQCVVRPTLGWRPAPADLPTYSSRSQMTIERSDGTTNTINSVYRLYSR
jgi:hypothetical protein